MRAIGNTEQERVGNGSVCLLVTECEEGERQREGQREPKMKSENEAPWVRCVSLKTWGGGETGRTVKD